MWQCVALFLLSFIIFQDLTQSLRLVEVRVPNYVIKGSTAQLECLYNLDGESLYSVKWYKDGNEFYRYVPREMPPAQTFLLPGVSVDVYNSSDAIVTLREVNLQSSGRFRCEVSGEAPAFQTVTEHGDMVVVSLPDQGPPRISGGHSRYRIGEWVHMNCTAGRSKPAVTLSWFINGNAAEPHTLRKYDTIISGREGLETSVLGLQFRVEQHHFRNGDIKLKCVASLSTFYWRSNEESIQGDRMPKRRVLESQETMYSSNSRADPVQANKTNSALTIKPFTLLLMVLMVFINSIGCLEHFFINNLLKIKNQSKALQEEEKFKRKLLVIKQNKTKGEKCIHFSKKTSFTPLPIILETTTRLKGISSAITTAVCALQMNTRETCTSSYKTTVPTCCCNGTFSTKEQNVEDIETRQKLGFLKLNLKIDFSKSSIFNSAI